MSPGAGLTNQLKIRKAVLGGRDTPRPCSGLGPHPPEAATSVTGLCMSGGNRWLWDQINYITV